MPANKSQTSKTFRRHVMPFAPVALALLMNSTPSSPAKPAARGVSEPAAEGSVTAETCDADITDFQDCHSRFPTGCSPAAGYDAYLNLLKNDLISPPPPSTAVTFLTESDYADLDRRIPDGLTRSNHSDFQDELKKMGEGQTRGVIGFLYYFKPTSAESSNCELSGPSDDPEKSNVDYHIGIGFDAATADGLRSDSVAATHTAAMARKSSGKATSGKAASLLERTSVIVEMTPHYRFQFENNIWTVENLDKAVGHQVRIVGQLLIDSEHNSPSQNCATAQTAAQKKSCWRASVWELHPVERFQVCTKATNDCAPEDANWAELDQI